MQALTIQFDFNLPERFGMEKLGEDGQAARPYMTPPRAAGQYGALFGSSSSTMAGLSSVAFPTSCSFPIADRL
jgi:threonyl-tRNA synthetase